MHDEDFKYEVAMAESDEELASLLDEVDRLSSAKDRLVYRAVLLGALGHVDQLIELLGQSGMLTGEIAETLFSLLAGRLAADRFDDEQVRALLTLTEGSATSPIPKAEVLYSLGVGPSSPTMVLRAAEPIIEAFQSFLGEADGPHGIAQFRCAFEDFDADRKSIGRFQAAAILNSGVEDPPVGRLRTGWGRRELKRVLNARGNS